MKIWSLNSMLEVCDELAEGSRTLTCRYSFSDTLTGEEIDSVLLSATVEDYFDNKIGHCFFSSDTKIHFIPLGSRNPLCNHNKDTLAFKMNSCRTKETFEQAYRNDYHKYFCKRCMKVWDGMGRNFDNHKGGMLALQGMDVRR